MKYIRYSLSAILLIVFFYIISGHFVFPANTPDIRNICVTLPGDNWNEILTDGTRRPFSVPGKTNKDIFLETTLPEYIDRDVNVLCFRGTDMLIYIGNELRSEYLIDDNPLLGDRSAECYVMVPLYPEDAGKQARQSRRLRKGSS